MKKIIILLASLIIFFALVSVGIYKSFWPSDWVDVVVGPFPQDAMRYCLIDLDAGSEHNLHWYEEKLFVFSMDPSKTGTRPLHFRDFDDSSFARDSVKWSNPKEIGVLVQDSSNQFTTFSCKASIDNNNFLSLFSTRKGHLHIKADSIKIPSDDFLKKLGFNKAE